VKVSGVIHSASIAFARTELKAAFHDADTDILVKILARIVARMSASRSACHRNNFRKSRVSVSDVSTRILIARMSASVSWNAALTPLLNLQLPSTNPASFVFTCV